eukprot:1840211-Prymnesium_polylepis.1
MSSCWPTCSRSSRSTRSTGGSATISSLGSLASGCPRCHPTPSQTRSPFKLHVRAVHRVCCAFFEPSLPPIASESPSPAPADS